MSTLTKVCSDCAQELPVDHFIVGKKTVRSMTRCRACRSVIQKVADRTIANRYSQNRAACKRRGIEWSISEGFFAEIQKHPCTYCGGPLPETGRGMDRLDPLVGYRDDNVVPCCGVCNDTRAFAFTFEEMKGEIGPAIGRVREGRRQRGGEPLVRGLQTKKKLIQEGKYIGGKTWKQLRKAGS